MALCISTCSAKRLLVGCFQQGTVVRPEPYDQWQLDQICPAAPVVLLGWLQTPHPVTESACTKQDKVTHPALEQC